VERRNDEAASATGAFRRLIEMAELLDLFLVQLWRMPARPAPLNLAS